MIMGLEQPDSGEIFMGQTVVPMYSEQSREGLSKDNTVRVCLRDRRCGLLMQEWQYLQHMNAERKHCHVCRGHSHAALMSSSRDGLCSCCASVSGL
jgi:ABC-type sulfate/molybdate transport systems ATPase subunit